MSGPGDTAIERVRAVAFNDIRLALLSGRMSVLEPSDEELSEIAGICSPADDGCHPTAMSAGWWQWVWRAHQKMLAVLRSEYRNTVNTTLEDPR